MSGDAGGVGELNPGAVACPAKDSGGPGLACIQGCCRADNAMGVIRRYSKPAQVLSDILPVVQCLQASRSRSWALEQGVGDFRAPPGRADGGGNAWRVLAAGSGCSSKRMRMPRMLRTSPKAGAIRRRMPSCSSMRRSRCPASVLRRASKERPGAALPGGSGGGCDGPRRAPVRSRSQTQAPGGQGWRRGGKRSWQHHSQTGVPRRYAPSPSRARFSASAAPCPCCSRPLRMA